MILSFISQKGGSGKTTLSVNLAALASSNGVPVAIVDLDPQASASAWCAARGTDDIRHEACHPPLLARTLERLREAGIALIVIDTPPHNSTAAANAIRASDFVAVPVRPSSFDLAAVTETVDLVRHANGRAGAVLNSVPSSTSVSDPAAAFLAQQNLVVLSRVGQRMAFQHAASTGRGVVETEPKSKAAEASSSGTPSRKDHDEERSRLCWFRYPRVAGEETHPAAAGRRRCRASPSSPPHQKRRRALQARCRRQGADNPVRPGRGHKQCPCRVGRSPGGRSDHRPETTT